MQQNQCGRVDSIRVANVWQMSAFLSSILPTANHLIVVFDSSVDDDDENKEKSEGRGRQREEEEGEETLFVRSPTND